MLFCRMLIFFLKPFCFRKIISELPSECQPYQFGDHARRLVRPELGPNCLQRLSSDDTSRQRALTESHHKTRYIICMMCE